MRRKRGPILSDDEVNRIRRDGISTHRHRKKKSIAAHHLERLRKLSILYPGLYSATPAQHRAMLKVETNLIREMKAKRKAERDLIRSPRSKEGQ